MTEDAPRWQPGSLWGAIERRTRRALACGALRPIETESSVIEDAGVRFLVRAVSGLDRKHEDKKRRQAERAAGRPGDPFLPYEPELFVAEVSGTHLCLLNKFNVIDHHLLIVTRAFEHQEALLDRADFEALWTCMAEYEAIGFYNGGAVAGASQTHKHLQLVPLPLSPQGPAIPMEALLPSPGPDPGVRTVPGLPFVHGFVRLDPALAAPPRRAAAVGLERYRALLQAVGLKAITVGGAPRQSGPYNLLVTRRWMLLVPRAREHCDSVSVNALGYAGSLFVRNRRELETVASRGPMAVLRDVSLPSP